MKKIIICNQIIIFSNFVMSEVLRYHWRWLVLHEWNWHYFFFNVRSPHITPSIKTSNNSFANIHSSTVQLQRKNHKKFFHKLDWLCTIIFLLRKYHTYYFFHFQDEIESKKIKLTYKITGFIDAKIKFLFLLIALASSSSSFWQTKIYN